MKPKICMITMFKNESKHIRSMLDSVAPHINYWVIQNNGSTDGTDEIVKQWAEETKIPGLLYDCEEGWVGFGWNRDHVLQMALKQDHGCDWIMKMDCDETFEVDDDYDWEEFKQDVPSFHVAAVNGGLIYYRAWIWKAGYPWRFNHDPAHETIYIDDGITGENFYRAGLSTKVRMRAGASYGESYSSPTKYVTDSLMLEEKMIREASFNSDMYHFWYIGKSYYDCYKSSALSLPDQQTEYAKRAIYYFESFIKQKFGRLHSEGNVDEMAYFSYNLMGQICRSQLKQYSKAVEYFRLAEGFCPKRNEHLVNMAELYWELRDYRRMHQITSILVDPERKMPFPEFYFIMHTELYQDTGKYVHTLHSIASSNLKEESEESALRVNIHQPKPRLWVVDNFYDDPYAVRNFAIQQEYEDSSDWYKGRRTFKQFLTPYVKNRFEQIMGITIREWESHGMNGRFQYCVPEDRLVYHYDSQTWAAMIYLTPNAPFTTGTSFYSSKITNTKHFDEPNTDLAFSGGFYDGTKFELVDTIGNVFNRLVIFDARLFHAASGYFGQKIEDARLFQIFFFD